MGVGAVPAGTFNLPEWFARVQAAASRLDGVAHRTPVLASRTLDGLVGSHVLLKCENYQRAGAFKFRGAYNAMSQLDPVARAKGVVAFSSGNHAQAVALAGRILGAPAVLVMPTDAPQAKVDGTAGYGAEIVRYDRLKEDRAAIARRLADERGLTLIPPFDHPEIIAGQGTAALELLQDAPDIDTLLVPIGGGGLIAGSSIASKSLKPEITVLGVEPALADDTARSLAAGKRVEIAPPDTIADGLRATAPGELTFSINQQLLDGVLTVTEEAIREAVRFALFRMKTLIEPSGAVGLAALMSGSVPAGRKVGVIISGGNIDPDVLGTMF